MFKRLWQAIKAFFTSNNSGDTVTQPSQPPLPTPSPRSNFKDLKVGDIGVDISHHNSTVNLAELAENVSFIYMKATEGVTFLSSVYLERARKLKEINVAWGAYHYYRIQSDPISQALHFYKYSDGWTLPPVLDIEQYGNEKYDHRKHTAGLYTFLKEVEKLTGFIPIVYTSFYYARDVIKFDERFAKYPLWLAWYTEDFGRVQVPPPWDNIKLWQKTEHGRIKGVTGNVDINEVMS